MNFEPTDLETFGGLAGVRSEVFYFGTAEIGRQYFTTRADIRRVVGMRGYTIGGENNLNDRGDFLAVFLFASGTFISLLDPNGDAVIDKLPYARIDSQAFNGGLPGPAPFPVLFRIVPRDIDLAASYIYSAQTANNNYAVEVFFL